MASDKIQQRDSIDLKMDSLVKCPRCEAPLIDGKCIECGYGFSEEEIPLDSDESKYE